MLFLSKLPKVLSRGSISTFSRCLSTQLMNVTQVGVPSKPIHASHVQTNLQRNDRLDHFFSVLNATAKTGNLWIWQNPTPITLPYIINPLIINDISEKMWKLPIEEPVNIDKQIEDPDTLNQQQIEAARLIVIRRKKMKKHKLKKLRKRMKYEWAKVRQRRELKKEKEFQAGLIAKCKEAEAFNAEEYVKEKLRLAAARPPPRYIDTDEYKEMMRIKKLRLYQYEPFKDYLK